MATVVNKAVLSRSHIMGGGFLDGKIWFWIRELGGELSAAWKTKLGSRRKGSLGTRETGEKETEKEFFICDIIWKQPEEIFFPCNIWTRFVPGKNRITPELVTRVNREEVYDMLLHFTLKCPTIKATIA